jgi:hypothetical protein
MTTMEIEAINGRIEALSMVMTAVISQMDKLPAARAAADLAMEQMTQKDMEEPSEQTQSKHAVVDAYLGLLSAVSKPY